MKILQVDKTVEYILCNLLTEDLHFLRYQKFPSKNGKKMIRRFDSSSVRNMNIEEIETAVKNENFILIKIEEVE